MFTTAPALAGADMNSTQPNATWRREDMKKKTKNKKPRPKPGAPPAPSPAPAVPAIDPAHVALRLKLPCAYTLLGYYRLIPDPLASRESPAYALVELLDGGNARYATYQVVNAEGFCTLGHFFSEIELRVAHEDFWRRTWVPPPHQKKGAKVSERKAWENDIALRAEAQARRAAAKEKKP
jgi:hypothetical protein